MGKERVSWLAKYWPVLVALALVVGAVVSFFVWPGLWAVSWPFLVVLLGIVASAVVPYLDAAFTSMRESGEWPVFRTRELVAALGAIGADLLGLLIYLATTEGALAEIASLSFVLAFILGWGGFGFAKDMARIVAKRRASRRT